MTDAEKISMVRILAESSDSDEVLSTYLKIAAREIINRVYPYDKNIATVPSEYEIKLCEIATYLLNKRGAEGQIIHSENGISRTYENANIPYSMLKDIVPYCGAIR